MVVFGIMVCDHERTEYEVVSIFRIHMHCLYTTMVVNSMKALLYSVYGVLPRTCFFLQVFGKRAGSRMLGRSVNSWEILEYSL